MPVADETDNNDQPKVLRDPVHNLIAIPGKDRKLILGLLDCPEFQRLRRIRQLGVSLFTYPGAEHSRWTHSLGVQHVARRMLDALRERYDGRAEFKDAMDELQPHRREILVAALLHDVGHGPFSHVFEKALPKVKNAPEGYPKDHEEWSERIIRECFAGYLTENGVSVDVVTGLINKKNRQNLLAKDFISSQLDADRMDYLLRDSHATGARYGEFDLEWLLHTLRIGKVAVKGAQEGRWRLCLDGDKATHVVEEYVLARAFMYVQVYIHKTSRAYEAMLRHILALAARICDGDPAKAPPLCPPALAKMLACKAVTTQEYLSLDDFRLWTTFLDWAELDPGDNPHRKALRDKCLRLVHRGRPYRFIELDSRKRQDKALELVADLKRTEQAFSCYRDVYDDVAYRNVFRRTSREEEQEDEEKEEGQEEFAIFLSEPDGRAQPLEARSDVIRAISEIETQIYRLYYDDEDPEMMTRLEGDGWLPKGEGTPRKAKETL